MGSSKRLAQGVITAPVAMISETAFFVIELYASDNHLPITAKSVTSEEFQFQYHVNNPSVPNNDCISIAVVGGAPPYTWEVEPDDFFFAVSERTGISNSICATGDACGTQRP